LLLFEFVLPALTARQARSCLVVVMGLSRSHSISKAYHWK